MNDCIRKGWKRQKSKTKQDGKRVRGDEDPSSHFSQGTHGQKKMMTWMYHGNS